MELKAALRDAAKANNIDLIGFASKDRFEGVPAHLNPFSIFPEGKTVILVGKRICRGSLRGVEEGSNFGDYALFGNSWLEDEFIAIACYDMTRVLEDDGWEAVPIFPNPPESGATGVSVREGAPPANVTPDFDYAAVACGLGEIAWSGLFFSAAFGARQRFQMIITDAEMESDPLAQGSICDQCKKCADVCPLGAISKEEYDEITICGKTMRVGKIDYSMCMRCENGCMLNRLMKTAKPDRIAALCNRTCMIHLEENKLVGNLFENKFRTAPAWGKDVLGRNVPVKD